MGFQDAARAGLVKRNGSDIFASGQGGSFFARIPIQGWNNNNVIVGVFDNSFGTWSAPTTITIGGTTTAPTKGTIVKDQVQCRKFGKDWFECEYRYSQTAGGANGSGNYLVSLPSGYTFDTTETPVYTTIDASNSVAASLAHIESDGQFYNSSANESKIKAIVYSSTQFRIGFPGSTVVFFGLGYYNLAQNPLAFFLKIRFKGTGPNN